MARSALLLSILVLIRGSHYALSFSFVPGAMRGTMSPVCSQSADIKFKPPLPRQIVFARSHDDIAAATGCLGGARRPGNSLSATASALVESSDYLEEKEALKQDLRDEYASFFDNFESDRYLPDVQFIDPVTSFTGFQNYKMNLDMLGGRSAIGQILFKDAGIVLHDIEEPAPFRLRTRWTLKVCFKALPWRPVARFTGISDYTLDDRARVVKQEDYWDSVNLVQGRYQAVNAIVGVKDFVGQVLPSPEERAPGGNGRAVGELLRRAKEYDVRLLEGREVVASREFDGDATAEAVRTNGQALLENLSIDGLTPANGSPELLSPGMTKEHQVSVALTEHDWMNILS